MTRHVLPLALLALLLSGCFGGLRREIPEARLYTLDPAPLAPGPEVNGGATVALRPFTASAAASDTQFLLRVDGSRVERDFHNRFVALPAQLVQESFADALASRGVFADVSPRGGDAAGAWVLDGHLARMEGDFSVTPPEAVLVVQLHLAPRRAGEGRRLVRTYEQRVPLATSSSSGLVEGWNTALGAILAEFAEDAGEHVAGKDEG